MAPPRQTVVKWRALADSVIMAPPGRYFFLITQSLPRLQIVIFSELFQTWCPVIVLYIQCTAEPLSVRVMHWTWMLNPIGIGASNMTDFTSPGHTVLWLPPHLIQAQPRPFLTSFNHGTVFLVIFSSQLEIVFARVPFVLATCKPSVLSQCEVEWFSPDWLFGLKYTGHRFGITSLFNHKLCDGAMLAWGTTVVGLC